MESTIHQKLVKIQQELKAPKNQRNNFGNYNYRSCEDILEAVKPLLNDLSLRIDDAVINVGTKNYIQATAYLSDGKDFITSTACAREAEDRKGMDDAQITGAASSYARKYALSGLFAIDDTKDADTMDNTKEVKKSLESHPTAPQTPEPDWMDKPQVNETPAMYATDKQVKFIHKLLDQKGQKKEDLYKKYDVESVSNLSLMDAKQIIDNLLKLEDKLPERDIYDDVQLAENEGHV